MCASDNFSSTQSAYRRHYSTETALLHTLDSIQQYADDTQIYIALTTADVTAHLTRLSSCLSVLHNWSCVTVFTDLIARLANLSFSQGVFPSKYKFAIVTPLLKKPTLDDQNPANFRPTSNLNNISKILEKLFLSRFHVHVCASDNFSSAWLAYRRHYSTETVLLHTLGSIYRSSEQGRLSLLVFLDLNTAFDTIDHHLLLDRLNESFGVSVTAHLWLRSNRHQSVRVGQSESPHTHCPTGVPQGSVLGPLLFTCYISPISSTATSFDASIQQYTDDTQIYIALTTANVTAHLTRLLSFLSTQLVLS